MSTSELMAKIEALPANLQTEVEDFVAFLANKRESQETTKNRVPGLGKGSFEILPGFDDPLEDFKEYM